MESIECSYCKEKFEDYASNNRKYCSRKCSDNSKKGISKPEHSQKMKGKKHSEEHNQKMSQIMKGRKISWADKISKAKKGKKQTEEHKQALRKTKTKTEKLLNYWNSKKGTKQSEETNQKRSKAMKGRKNTWLIGKTPWNKGKSLEAIKGKNHWNWKGGVSFDRSPLRYGDDWDKIRLVIYRRDGFVCQDCGMTMNESRDKWGQGLHIHHKTPFVLSLDNSLSNLITLCKSCHGRAEAEINKKLKNEVMKNA
jgi:hypothetical protein